MLDVLEPKTALCYGELSDGLKAEYNFRKISIKTYPTEISKVYRIKDAFQQLYLFD